MIKQIYRIQSVIFFFFLLIDNKNHNACFLPLCFVGFIFFVIFEIINKYGGNQKILHQLLTVIIYLSLNLIGLIFLNVSVFIIFSFIVFVKVYFIFSQKISLIINFAVSIIYFVLLYLQNSKIECLLVLIINYFAFCFFKIIRDTELELRKENKELKIQNKEINKLLSTLAHELRTPLMIIKTSTEILLEERPGKIVPAQKKFLQATFENTMRMIKFSDSLLASTKVNYSCFKMKKKVIDIRSSIRKVCSDMQSLIQSRNQELNYNYPNLITKTIGDEKWLQQVLINLIHNASKHIKENGKIIITATENEECIVVSVSDDGSGIINDDKPKIFSEFYQGADENKNETEGVGLGLSIVKNVIEKHGGEVYIASVAGMGTTICFTLPKEE